MSDSLTSFIGFLRKEYSIIELLNSSRNASKLNFFDLKIIISYLLLFQIGEPLKYIVTSF